MKSEDETISEQEKERQRLQKLEDAMNAESDDEQLARRQESRDALEPSIREHSRFLCASKAAAAKKFVR